jgi:hypothetical protein
MYDHATSGGAARQESWLFQGDNRASLQMYSLLVARVSWWRTWMYLHSMIVIGDTLLSEDVFEHLFACDLSVCKGVCCVAGESGAPLLDEELELLEQAFDEVKDVLRPEALEVIEKVGLYELDSDGDVVTPIINGKECVYALFDENGTAKCSFEQAYRDGRTRWKKPMSCHLYPIRIKELKDFTALNVHQWDICEGGRSCGKASGTTVLEFCRESLTRRFGEEWYAEALLTLAEWKKAKNP